MPTYLCHGFRWHRRSIRYFVVIQNVDEASPDWIVAHQSSVALLDQFYELFDFLPPCSHPVRNPFPLPTYDPIRPPTSNGHAHSRTRSYASQGNKEKDIIFENGDARNTSSQPSTRSNRSKSVGQPTATNTIYEDMISPLEPPSPVLDESIPFNDWSVVKFIEEFDPTDLSVVSGPWAYVADYVVRIDTSVSVTEEINRYEARMKTHPYKSMSGASDEGGRRINTIGNRRAGWFEKLRDQLQRSESIRWYVVVCGDEERAGAELEESEEVENKTNGQSSRQGLSSIRGFVENGFEFRLPEFLVSSPRTSEQGPRRRRMRKEAAKQDSTAPAVGQQQAIPPPPAPIQVVHKMPADNGVKHKSSLSSGGLRRLFLRRKPDGPT
ncbi:uncharacterized protein F4822DRAFT_322313 [Hypoxylon trugodes]|uniref:uncharacterized protein n=1 Tax=Hypoxylon trugodes TaxID=326681 RepID=UPI00218DD404|nr:uncharacterized protein F4822DRAFT_322313 [Hypoxylon trugodes]KAI1386635.1 hypothetical protein F4822DRAFT_322313 [Hypoxylon trugodes]